MAPLPGPGHCRGHRRGAATARVWVERRGKEHERRMSLVKRACSGDSRSMAFGEIRVPGRVLWESAWEAGGPGQTVAMLWALNPIPRALSCALSDYEPEGPKQKSDANPDFMKVTLAFGEGVGLRWRPKFLGESQTQRYTGFSGHSVLCVLLCLLTSGFSLEGQPGCRPGYWQSYLQSVTC